MTELTNSNQLNQDELKQTLSLLQDSFPSLEVVHLSQSILGSPYLPRLAKLEHLSIPVDAYPPQVFELYQQINGIYYQQLFRLQKQEQPEDRRTEIISQAINSNDIDKLQQQQIIQEEEPVIQRSKFNYMDLAKYVQNFSKQKETLVCPELVQMGRAFDSWGVKTIATNQFNPSKLQKQDSKLSKHSKYSKPESADLKFAKKQSQVSESVQIMLGKNISLECKDMRHEIINRAKNNKLLEENTRLTQLEKIGIEINYILNRITQEFFDDFLGELRPYAQDQIYSFILSDKIIEKVMEEHNFIGIYSKLVKKLKDVKVLLGGDKLLRFKNIFVQKLQESFYSLIRKGQWESKEQQRKKELIGMSLFVGELFHIRFLSKYIFQDCFYELVRSYVVHYQKYKSNKSSFYYETYIECVIKIIEKMNKYYEELLNKKNTDSVKDVVNELLESPSLEDHNFKFVCDYIEVLKSINEKLPSQRFKITFLLEDFRCSRIINKSKETLDNIEGQIVKTLLSMDISKEEEAKKIPSMLKSCNLEALMKDFLFQFAQGNQKSVTRNIQVFKVMSEVSGICDSTITAIKDNVDGLYAIQCDFPFLCEGMAKMLKNVCEEKKLDFNELQLGEQDHEDEDIREFLQKVEEKYYKMIMQD